MGLMVILMIIGFLVVTTVIVGLAAPTVCSSGINTLALPEMYAMCAGHELGNELNE
jgi:hypothetical protein